MYGSVLDGSGWCGSDGGVFSSCFWMIFDFQAIKEKSGLMFKFMGGIECDCCSKANIWPSMQMPTLFSLNVDDDERDKCWEINVCFFMVVIFIFTK